MAGPLKIAHRGASGYEKENTLPAFKKALELGVDMIEFDVHVSQDGKAVVIHDETVDRTTDSSGLVRNKTIQELQALGIPTLEQVLELIHKKALVYIELKTSDTPEVVARIITDYVANKAWHYNDFLVCSDDPVTLLTFKNKLPYVAVGFVFDLGQTMSEMPKVPVDVFVFHQESIDNDLVAHVRQLGKRIFAYGVNTKEESKRLKQLGIDGIISDYPDRI